MTNVVGTQPYGVFVNTNNTVYVADRANGRIQIWLNDSVNATKTVSGNLTTPYSIFPRINGDMYLDNSYSSIRVEKRTLNANTSVSVMSLNTPCYGLFIDISDTLYCSQTNSHQVVKRWLGDVATTLTNVAGTGSYGSASNLLYSPCAIFIDTDFDLYVADSGNNRIQLFELGQTNGITVAGYGSLNTTITLNCPTGVVLDADKYLFIVDSNNHRIVGSGPNGFRCLVGCIGSGGGGSNQLFIPWSLSFDSYGNLFVTDQWNSRLQKLFLMKNTCGKYKKTKQYYESTEVEFYFTRYYLCSVRKPLKKLVHAYKIMKNRNERKLRV